MSAGTVLSFLRRASSSGDWSQQELAEFYRVESALLQAGLSVVTDRGISDEGDPWFAFCRADNEEVIAHFARIDGEYAIISSLHPSGACGRDFRLLVRQMLEAHPLMLPVKRRQGQKIFLHPAALLTAMLASAYFLTSEKESAGGNVSLDGHSKSTSVVSFLTQKFMVLAAAGLAAVWFEHQAESVYKFLESTLTGITPSDDNAAHTITAANDAQLDTAITHAMRAELAADRSDLVNSNLPTPEGGDGNDQGKLAATQGAEFNSTLLSGPDENSVISASASNGSTNNDHIATAHSDVIQIDTDSAIVGGNPQPTFVKEVEPIQASLPSFASSGAIVATSEAILQLAVSDASSSLIQPIVLSAEPEPLSYALQQAFTQAGLSVDTAVVNTAASSTATASPSTSGQVLQTLEAFLRDTPSFEVTISGSNVIIIDTNASDEGSPDFGVLTFNLGDGHTLSIVGILPAHHAASSA